MDKLPGNVVNYMDLKQNILSILQFRSFRILIQFLIGLPGTYILYSQSVAYEDKIANLTFEQIDIRNGLSSNVVYCVIQDQFGFMWFGTEDGLDKYDGYKFTKFDIGPEGGQFISNSRINALCEDRFGYIWIGTDGGGLNRYNPDTETITYFYSDPEDPESLSGNKILSVIEDHDGIIWIGTSNGLNKLIQNNPDDTVKFIRFKHIPGDPASLNSNRIFCLYVDKSNNLWIGTEDNGLSLVTPSGRSGQKIRCKHYNSDPLNNSSLSNDGVFSIFQDHTGILWIGTGDGLNKFYYNIPGEQERFIQYHNDPDNISTLSDNKVYSILEDSKQNLWIGTIGGGLNLLIQEDMSDPDNYKFKHFTYDPLNPESLFSNTIYSLYETPPGVLWFTTNNDGIGKMDLNRHKFYHLKHIPGNPNSLSNQVVKAILEDKKGNIWFGTWGGGLTRYHKNTGKFVHYVHDPDNSNTISHDMVQAIIEDMNGNLWIGTVGGGLNKFDPKTETFTRYSKEFGNENSLICDDVWSLFPGRDGSTIWIGTYEGLEKFDFRRNKFTHYYNIPDNPQSLIFNDIRALFEDRSGYLWVGTAGGGLDRLDIKNGIFAHHSHDPQHPASISNNSIYSIFEDRSGILWVGTLGGGLNKVVTDSAGYIQFIHYRKSDGLANDVVKSVLEDDYGFLWISTTNGLSRFDSETGECKNYSVSDGLLDNIFNLGACCKTRDGEIYFGGVSGVNYFRPEDIKDNTFVPPVYITDFRISNKPVLVDQEIDGKVLLSKSIIKTNEINLTHKHEVISFEFTALSYTSQDKNQYGYMLEGLEADWIYTGSNGRYVTYSNLAPGSYSFRVKASNNDGVWNETGTSVIIHISPPVWLTVWAFIVYGIIIAGLFYLARRFARNRKLLKEELRLEREEHRRKVELNQMKLRFFTNISHEFRTPLTLIIGPIQKLLYSDSELSPYDRRSLYRILNRNANHLLQLINQLMDFRKAEQEQMKLTVSQGDIIAEIRKITDSFKSYAEKRKIELNIFSTAENLITWYDPDKVEKILSNLLSNAFKYTPIGGKVEVFISMCSHDESRLLANVLRTMKDQNVSQEFLCIEIRDTGIGIDEKEFEKIFERFYQVDHKGKFDNPGTGIGLALVKKIVELHYGKIEVKSKVGTGSSFFVYLPVGNIFFKEEELEKKAELSVLPEERSDISSIPDDDSYSEKENSKKYKNIHYRITGTMKRYKHQAPLIVIIEDNPDLRSFLKEDLEKKYSVLEAENGIVGLDLATRKNPDLIISDIIMPEMDGLEFCRKLKTDIRISHIPVILLTARSTLEHQLEGLETGADAYLTKPFQMKHLFALIQNILENRQRLRKKFSKEAIVSPKDVTITSVDEKFLKKALDIVEKNISDPYFSVDKFASEMGYSHVQLFRKLKAICDMAPNEFVRNIRLKKAAQLLICEKSTVGEVLYKVGFNNRSYFNRCFRHFFGTSPVEYVQNHL